MAPKFASSEWFAMVVDTIADLHIQEGYPLTSWTAGPMFYQARELGHDGEMLRAYLRTQPRPVPLPAPEPVPGPEPVPEPEPSPVPEPEPHPGGPMPNRSQEVRMICDLHPEAFPYVFDPKHPEKPGVTDEELNAARFHLLREFIVPTLNALDGGGWGLLMKKDQHDKIPVDILCWRPTVDAEYMDVMSGTGATWQHRANPMPGVWIWVKA